MPHTFPLPTQSEPCSARPSSPAEPVLPRNQGRVQTCTRLGSLTAVVKHDRESGGLEQCRFLLTQFWRLKGHDPFQWGQSQGVDRAASLKGLEASPSRCCPPSCIISAFCFHHHISCVPSDPSVPPLTNTNPFLLEPPGQSRMLFSSQDPYLNHVCKAPLSP